MGDARAQVEITADASKLSQGLRTASSKFRTWASSMRSGMKDIGKSAAGHAAGQVVGNLATRGIDAFADQAVAVRDFEKSMTRLGITANRNSAQLADYKSSLKQTSKETGIGTDKLSQAAGVYFDLTSDADGLSTAMNTFARVAQASGSEMDDITRAAAAMEDSMDIKPAQMEAVFSGLINQGKAGKIGLKDFGSELVGLAPKFAKMSGGKGVAGVMQLGAAFQVAAKGFGTAAEASTGIEALIAAFEEHAPKIKAIGGVKIFEKGKDGVKHMRDLHTIINEIGKSKLVKDPELMRKAIGNRKEALDTVAMLLRFPDLYNEIAAAGNDAGVVQHDLAAYMDSDSGRIDAAINRVKLSLAEAFTPERIVAFTNAVEGLADKVGTIASGLGKVGDVMGALYGAGQSIRGALSGNANNNPFGPSKEGGIPGRIKSFMTEAGKLRGGASGGVEDMAQQAAAERRAANKESYDKTVSDIMGGEVNERTSPESIKRAVIASMTDNSMEGGLGTSTAGRRYLDAAGVSPEKAAEIYGKATAEALAPTLAKIGELARAIADGRTDVKVDGDAVAKANSKARGHRRKP